VSALVLYEVGMNVALRTHLFRDALRSVQHDVNVDYASAYSIVPGRIHVKGLTIRGEDGSVQWILTIARCGFNVSFPPLFHRHFLARHIDADGLTFRIRIKYRQATPDHIAALPGLEGFGPPLKAPGPPSPPPTDAQYNLWEVELEGVDVHHLSQLWVDTLRFTGDMHLQGRWVYRPLRWLEVGPTSIQGLREISYGRQPLLLELTTSLFVTVHPLSIRPEVSDLGQSLVHHVSADARLDGRLSTARVLGLAFASERAEFEGPDARATLHLTLDHGKLARGTDARIDDVQTTGHAFGASLDLGASAELSVDGSPPMSALLSVHARDLVLRRAEANARLHRLEIAVTSHDVDLMQSLEEASFAVDVNGLTSPDVGGWARQLPDHFGVRAGALAVDAHLEGRRRQDDWRAGGDVNFSAPGVVVGGDNGDRIEGGVSGHVRIVEMTSKGEGEIAAQVNGQKLVAQSRSGRLTAGLFARIQARRNADARVDVSRTSIELDAVEACPASASTGPSCIQAGRIAIDVPSLHIHDRQSTGTVSLRVPQAHLDDVSAVLGAIAPKNVHVLGGSATATLRLDVDTASLAATGDVTLDAHGLEVQAASDVANTDAFIRLRAQGHGEVTDLSGSQLTIGRSAGEPDNQRWWGQMSFPAATLTVKGGPRVKASVHLSAKDASPVVAFVGATTPVPKWLANIPSTSGVIGDAELQATPSSFEVQSASARAGAVAVCAVYAKEEDNARGALLVQYGFLRAGIGLGPGKFVLFGAEPWFNTIAGELHDPSAEMR
jgi:hypothetical protein